MKQFPFGLFLWILCLVLAIGQLRYQPGCPRWLRPIPEEARKPGRQYLGTQGIQLLLLVACVGLLIHLMT